MISLFLQRASQTLAERRCPDHLAIHEGERALEDYQQGSFVVHNKHSEDLH